MVKDPGKVVKLEHDIKSGTRKESSHVANKKPATHDHKKEETPPKSAPKKEK